MKVRSLSFDFQVSKRNFLSEKRIISWEGYSSIAKSKFRSRTYKNKLPRALKKATIVCVFDLQNLCRILHISWWSYLRAACERLTKSRATSSTRNFMVFAYSTRTERKGEGRNMPMTFLYTLDHVTGMSFVTRLRL